MSSHTHTDDLEPLWAEKDAAEYLCVGNNTLGQWRARKQGPPYLKLGTAKSGLVRYRKKDIDKWMEQTAVDPTAEQTAVDPTAEQTTPTKQTEQVPQELIVVLGMEDGMFTFAEIHSDPRYAKQAIDAITPTICFTTVIHCKQIGDKWISSTEPVPWRAQVQHQLYKKGK
jgi:hypothetical protein